MIAYIEVTRPDGTSERQRIEGEQTTIGSSPAAGISLPGVDGLAAEHVQVIPRMEGCWVAVAKGAPRARVGGQEFDSGMCPWNSEIELAGLRIRFLDKSPQDEKAVEKKTSPVLFLALAIVPFILWMVLQEDNGSLPSASGPPPDLFAAVNACPATGPNAQNLADEKAEAADAKAERYVFDAQDGVESVRLFALASRCYAAVGRNDDSARMLRRGTAMQHTITSDYRNYQLRLDRATRYDRWEDALAATTALQNLTRHLDTPYTQFLNNLSRSLQAKIAEIAARRPE